MRTLCTPELVDRLAARLTSGTSITDSCALEGITPRAYHKWRARGEAELTRLDTDDDEPEVEPDPREAPFVHFVHTVELARLASKARAVDVIHTAYDGWTETVTVETLDSDNNVTETKRTTSRKFDWRAALVWLERRYPEEFGRRMNRMETPGEVAQGEASGEAPQSTEELLTLGIAVLERERRKRDEATG